MIIWYLRYAISIHTQGVRSHRVGSWSDQHLEVIANDFIRGARYSNDKAIGQISSKMIILISQIRNKKLCYREEHSASVVLSWCTL